MEKINDKDVMDRIELTEFTDEIDNYRTMYRWCSNKFVYEWFEQRILNLEDIIKKYKSKLQNKKQSLFFIKYNGKKIGYVQIYKYSDKKNRYLDKYNNIYEYDIFIGEKNFLSRGIGTKVINYIDYYIYNNFLAECIILRPFKRNKIAIKCYEKNDFHKLLEYEDMNTIGKKEIIVMMINQRNGENIDDSRIF